jgi:hypothetical protein
MNFYIGTAGRKGEGNNSVTNVMAIKNKQDFLEGSFDDLIIMNKSGLMVTEESTLHLVDKAKKKLDPYAFRRFNDIMRQYYDSDRNPVRHTDNTAKNTNMNNEIVSSVQPVTEAEANTATKTGKRHTLTLDLLLPRSNNDEVLASEDQESRTRITRRDEMNSFNITDYISNVYGYDNMQPKQQRERQQGKNDNNKKLTLADLLNARERSKGRTCLLAFTIMEHSY